MEQHRQNETGSAALMDAIRQQADERVAEINRKAEKELGGIEEEHAALVASFAREMEASGQRQMEQERARMLNTAAIETKKLRLTKLDEFISRMIAMAVEKLLAQRRQDYRRFLTTSAGAALSRIPDGRAVIHLSPADVEQEGTELLRSLRSTVGPEVELELAADTTIGTGGCIVEHTGRGVAYIATIEKALSRNRGRIRSRVLDLISKNGYTALAESAGREARP